MMRSTLRHDSVRGFTLLEILMVVVILGIVAAIVVPRSSMATMQARDTGIRRQLQTVRAQIALYRARHSSNDPDMTNWDDLVLGGYIKTEPKNPMNGATAIGADDDFSGGWIWRDGGTGVNQLFGTNIDHSGEFEE